MAPRVFIARHGETEWSLSGQHTSTTELELTENGVKRAKMTGNAMVGPDRLICPDRLKMVICSPRKRARQTLSLLGLPKETDIEINEDLREWDYGKYEGKTSKQINEMRNNGKIWDIWRDGCEGGESPHQVTRRVDELISRIQKVQEEAIRNKAEADVLLVCHGHIGRSIAIRWIQLALESGPHLILPAMGIGVLSYEHDSVNEPALLLGGSFV